MGEEVTAFGQYPEVHLSDGLTKLLGHDWFPSRKVNGSLVYWTVLWHFETCLCGNMDWSNSVASGHKLSKIRRHKVSSCSYKSSEALWVTCSCFFMTMRNLVKLRYVISETVRNLWSYLRWFTLLVPFESGLPFFSRWTRIDRAKVQSRFSSCRLSFMVGNLFFEFHKYTGQRVRPLSDLHLRHSVSPESPSVGSWVNCFMSGCLEVWFHLGSNMGFPQN